jgi:hypothetical protein
MVDLYYTSFYPHLIYGIEFWGHASSTELNKLYILHKKALRIILKIKSNETETANFAILKIMPAQMLFRYCLVFHFVSSLTNTEIQNLKIHHNYETRLKCTN